MLKLLGSLLIASGGMLAWFLQLSERKRRRDTLSDLQTAFRRMGEEVRMARTPLPILLEGLAGECGPDAAAFFAAVSQAAMEGENLPAVWRREAEKLPLDGEERSAVLQLGNDLQGDEEKVCKAVSHVIYTLAKGAERAERERPEKERRAAALWFSASALLVILLL